MLCGIMLAGLCDKYEIKKDAETADWARKIAKGLMLADTVHGDPGFVARGVSPVDGKSVYPETSRDQYTHNIHGLWRYFNSPIATDAEKKEIAEAEKNKLAITGAMETELSLEGVIKSMGFDDVVISASGEYYNIMVKAKELTDNEVAKILEAVTAQTDATANYVRIIPVE